MVKTIQEIGETRKKVFFIRVGEEEYKKIAVLAESEDRSINNMANLLLKSALNNSVKA